MEGVPTVHSESLEQEILSRIVPNKDFEDSIKDKAERLKAMVESYVAERGIDAEARLVGSFAKNTYLDDPDLDLFLLFPPEVSHEDLKRVGLQAGEDILHGERLFSDHPYTRGVFEGVEVDMVPCYRVESTENLQSAVDRTPFHAEFITANLDEDGCNQVRLMKKFMKGIGAYGAEQDSRGFSGYLCEVLIVKYGTFRNALEAASKWKPGMSLAIREKGPAFDSALVVYDPVDPKRNMASSVHLDTLCLFIVAAREYLKCPREEFFFPRKRVPLSSEELGRIATSHQSRLFAVEFQAAEGSIADNLASQLWKTQNALSKRLSEFSFTVLRAVHSMEDGRMTVLFEMEDDRLSRTCLHEGPPAWVNSESFIAKWRENPEGEPFIRDGHWYVVRTRRYTTAKDMVIGEIERSGIGKEFPISTMRVYDHQETLDNVDPLLVSELLEPRFPWEN